MRCAMMYLRLYLRFLYRLRFGRTGQLSRLASKLCESFHTTSNRCVLLAGIFALVSPAICWAEISANLLKNSDFAQGVNSKGIPIGWSLYGGVGKHQQIKVLSLGEADDRAVLLQDGDPDKEIGLTQTVPIEGGLNYEASVEIRVGPGDSSYGAYLQLRFLPSNKYVQTSLSCLDTDNFQRFSIRGSAPPDTQKAVVYLYTHAWPTPKLLLRKAKLISGVGPPKPPYPEPVSPVYTKLKNLYLDTKLVSDDKPNVTIIAGNSGLYEEQARRIQEAIKNRTGTKVSLTHGQSAAAVIPIEANLIVLGNRSTNAAIAELYNRYYTLLDLRYPGPDGYVVRTLHNPFGNGHNVIFVGGSDTVGVNKATDVFIEKLNKAGASPGEMVIGRLAEIELGKGIQVPTDFKDFKTWEASKGYRSCGYFGWNIISKRMALYYMTGDEFHAAEFLRLAFPDEQAKQELARIDGELTENKDAPLSGPYHYNAHMLILFWDLIEESPVFTDQQRLRITNAFAQQLQHRKDEGIYRRTNVSQAVGTRHTQWAAISLYCLGRYFQKYYPDPVWQQCIEGAKHAFEPLHHHEWVWGESDNLYWYSTGIAPIFTYLILSGDRKPLENGVLDKLLRGQEILITGRMADWALRYASMGYLHKAAYLTQDGRYIHYRQRSGVDTNVFRLGQSFWPEEHLTPKSPEDMVGDWNINHLPKLMWQARKSGLAFEESFMFGSYRSTSDASGDFILIDGYNGASRNPYHTFAVLELRIGGYTLLKGYRNQLMVKVDGLVEPKIPMDAALKEHQVIGKSAVVVGEVPNAPFCNWQRTLVQRIGRYALLADELTFREDSDNVEVQIQWETEHPLQSSASGGFDFTAPTETPESRTAKGGQIRTCDSMTTATKSNLGTMQWLGPATKGGKRIFFSLVGIQPDTEKPSLDCIRLSDNAAALALPGPALAVAGQYQRIDAQLAVLEKNHLFGKGLSRLSRQDAGAPAIISANSPVDIDWDFESGRLYMNSNQDVQVDLVLAADHGTRLNGQSLKNQLGPQGQVRLKLKAGEHLIESAKPRADDLNKINDYLTGNLIQARNYREKIKIADSTKTQKKLPTLHDTMIARVGEQVVDMITVPSTNGDLIYVAEGNKVHGIASDGTKLFTLETDGTIRDLCWWPEHHLLLVGCADEKVIAFDSEGKRKWEFTSVMDPAVFRAAKNYWFKSAPGHEGIHGLHTGVFLDGKSQAFVGSACTLEILDHNGNLIKRMPQFWGKVSHFVIIDGPNGSLNLLAARKYNGVNTVAIINNKTLDPDPRGFYSVPSTSTYVPGWASMNRHHLFYEDLDGDGTKEVISEINGTWNRVTVWQANGQALYDASFGPGERIPARNMRDLDIADLDGNGKKEILAATSSGLLVAFDHTCTKIWAKRLNSPPMVMKCLIPQPGLKPRIVVGCEDGTVLALNGQGKVICSGKMAGRPTHIAELRNSSGQIMPLLTSDKGIIKAFMLDP